MITETQAWHLGLTFAQILAATAPDDIVAVFVIGSLATGAYRPGRSDIDMLIVIRDESPESTLTTVRQLRDNYLRTYAIPKGLGAVVIRQRMLWPPYDPEQELVPEILRLKQQGVLVWGEFDVTAISEPSAADQRAYITVFYRWLHAHYVAQRPEEARTVNATVNTILYELRVLVWNATGVYVLDKQAVLVQARSFMNNPQLHHISTFVQAYLNGEDEDPVPLVFWEDALQVVAQHVYAQLPTLAPGDVQS